MPCLYSLIGLLNHSELVLINYIGADQHTRTRHSYFNMRLNKNLIVQF